MPLKNKKSNPDVIIVKKKDDHPPEAHDDESGWLVSYADMMTLLCGFFIMLFSMAKLDTPKYDSFKEAVSKQFGGEYVSPTKELARYATQIIQELGVETTTTIKSDYQGVSIVFESAVFFGTNSAEVSPEGNRILKKLITSISDRQKTNAKIYRIVVEGHTDGRPIIGGHFPSNWELSAARAARVVRMFLDKGFAGDRLTAIGYADTYPKMEGRSPAGNWDEKALAKNRRVVLRVLEPDVDAIPFPEEARPPRPSPLPSPQPSGSPQASASGVPAAAVVAAAPSPAPEVHDMKPNQIKPPVKPRPAPTKKHKIESLSEIVHEPEPEPSPSPSVTASETSHSH